MTGPTYTQNIESETGSFAWTLVNREVGATLEVQNTYGFDVVHALQDARRARAELVTLLNVLKEWQDIDLILEVERIFLVEELEHLAHLPRKVRSLRLAIR